MLTYHIFQTIVLTYSAFVAIITIFMFSFEISSGFGNSLEAKRKLHKVLNQLRGRITILLPLRLFSVISLFCWIALALPWVDIYFNLNYISSLHDGTFTTWFGSFVGRQGDYYFGTVFVSIIGIKGFFLIQPIANILSDDTLVVEEGGHIRYRTEL